MSEANPIQARGTVVALLFTDIEGSTRKWETYPDEMRAALCRHDATLRNAFGAAGGEVFKSTGDGFCVVFASVVAAVIAAWQAQTLMGTEDFADVGGIRVRMAVHTGAVEARDGDFFGPAANRVARLLAVAHGGQVLLSGIAAEFLNGMLPPTARLRDLGQHALQSMARPEHVYQLVAPSLPAAFPPLHSLHPPPNNLPEQTVRLIGRDADRDAIATLLLNHRLVTILGAGGLGKTRMAIELGASLLSQYPDGVWFVEFAALQDASRLTETLRSALGITSISDRQTNETIISFLREQRALLIFDNCEHLVEEAASLAGIILKAAKGVSVLATSRERLSLQGEAVFRLPPLGSPESAGVLTARQAIEFSAIELFMQRASGLALTDENAQDIAAICRRLDGIPLAIELAASRMRMLRPAELLARLNDRFAILTGGSRTALPRQQTLRAMIAWSYDLLTEAEQCVVRRLAVFPTSFSLRSAADVCVFGKVESDALFDVFAALIDKSMISPVPGTSGLESRYRLLETTRQYCSGLLQSSNEIADAQCRFIATMITLYKSGEACWPAMHSASWRAIYEPDAENMRAALGAAFGVSGDRALGLALVSATRHFWYEVVSGGETQLWLERAQSRIRGDTPRDVQAHIHLGIAMGGLRGTLASALRAHQLFHEIGDEVHAPVAAAIAGRLLARQGKVTAARYYFDEVAAALPQFGKTKLRAWLLDAMAASAFYDGNAEQAFAFTVESVNISRHYGDLLAVLFHGIGLGDGTLFAVDVVGAAALRRELVEHHGERRDRFRLAWVLAHLVGYHLRDNDFDAARAAGRDVIAMYDSAGCEFVVAMCADEMALLAAHKGDLATAARLTAYGWAYRAANDLPHFKAKVSIMDQIYNLIEMKLPPESRDVYTAEGAAWTADEAAAAALAA